MRVLLSLVVGALWSVFAAAQGNRTVIVPSNSTSYVEPPKNGRLYLVPYCIGVPSLQLIPLTPSATAVALAALNNNVVSRTPITYYGPGQDVQAESGAILYMPCDPQEYNSGMLSLNTYIEDAVPLADAIILYSETANYCEVVSTNSTYPLFSMSSIRNSTSLGGRPVNVSILLQAQINNTTKPSCKSVTPTKDLPPSTAVAMIILYAITGIITLLFLVIIVTGAVRAHRHPEQYGPRNVLGRARQSRAKGIARAMLDTLPIVKFGEHDENSGDIQKDVELTGGSVAPGATTEQDGKADALTTVDQSSTSDPTRISREIATDDGPAPVMTNTGIAASGENDIDRGLMCSICTEEFERGEDIRLLPCNHKYHPACVDPWLLNVSGTCPLCRIELCPPTAGSEDGADGLEAGAEDGTDASAVGGTDSAPAISRRRSTFRALLNRGRMQTATPEERIATLRRYREEQRQRQLSGGHRQSPTQRVRPRYRSLRGPW